MNIINGAQLAEQAYRDLRTVVDDLTFEPALGVVLVGSDYGSELYVRNKQKAGLKAGVEVRVYKFDADAPHADIENTIAFLNEDLETHGIIIQLPLPERYDQDALIAQMNPLKDADGFHPTNQDLVIEGVQTVTPVFPSAILALIAQVHENIDGKSAVVVGKSDVFDRMMTHALESMGATAVFVHADDLEAERSTVAHAEIVVSAVGRPGILSGADFQDGAVVIDGGISVKDGKTVGDVDAESCAKKEIYLSPVPGGVGPMTVAKLLENTVALGKEQTGEEL